MEKVTLVCSGAAFSDKSHVNVTAILERPKYMPVNREAADFLNNITITFTFLVQI